MTTLALIDFGSLFGVRYHANGDDAASARNQCVGYVRDMLHRYDVVACCIDSPPYQRSEVYPLYKKHREPWPAGAMELKEATIEEVAQLCHVLGAPGYEADDVIATVVAWVSTNVVSFAHKGQGHPVDVYSADKDLTQLCGRADVLKLDGTPHDLGGLAPELVPDYLALIGDSSDNLPGVDGIGKAKARALLEAFGDLDGISRATATQIQALPGFGPSVAGKLLAAWDVPPGELTPFDVRELVRLEATAPIDCSVLTIPTTPKEETETMPDEIPPPESTRPSSVERGHARSTSGHTSVERADSRSTVVHEAQPVSSQPRPATTKALATYEVSYERALEPVDPEMAWKYSVKLFNSGLFRLRNPESAFAVILEGRSFGLGTMESLRGIEMVDGKPSMKSSLIQALCEKNPACEYFMPTEVTSERVTMETKRRGHPKPVTVTWTMEDAQRAGLVGKDNWRKYPRAMLVARCRAELGRLVYPDTVHNVYCPDELGVVVDSPEAA